MLTPYATQALQTLHRLLPDLAALAIEQEDYFTINTTAPSGQSLWLSAADEEMTVGFAEHHTHFGWHQGDPTEDAVAAAEYVQSLQAGQFVVVAWYEGEEFVGSITQQVDQPVPPPTWLQSWWRRKQHQVVRYWAE
jgi:hypothetical protein